MSSVLSSRPFAGYTYAYPHKTAYRRLDPPIPLADAWRDERVDSLFLYLHVPFCEFRCGFCNLFTISQPSTHLPDQYLAAVERQANAIRRYLPAARFASMAIGGGTPTFLNCEQFDRLFHIVHSLGADPRRIPLSCEASPATLSLEKLKLLKDAGVDRLSLGVQSFEQREAHAMGRPQDQDHVERGLTMIRDVGFPTLNIDLIYGGAGQSLASWLQSIERALRFAPEEVYLYPLYVRPLTGLGRREGVASHIDESLDESDRQWDEQRLEAYREGRDLLLARGYQQASLRMFRASDALVTDAPTYRCQEDGMIGIGCGARSYTRDLHYSQEYAVDSKAIQQIVESYIAREESDFAHVEFGCRLDEEDQRRRHVVISLLQSEGVSQDAYRRRFAGDPLHDLPQLLSLLEDGLAEVEGDTLRLTASGMERSDAIGPWLYSDRVRRLMEEYQWR